MIRKKSPFDYKELETTKSKIIKRVKENNKLTINSDTEFKSAFKDYVKKMNLDNRDESILLEFFELSVSNTSDDVDAETGLFIVRDRSFRNEEFSKLNYNMRKLWDLIDEGGGGTGGDAKFGNGEPTKNQPKPAQEMIDDYDSATVQPIINELNKLENSSKFKTDEEPKELSINTGIVKTKNLLTENKIQDLIDASGGGGTGGDAKFNTGEKVSDTGIEKVDEIDTTLITSKKVDEKLLTKADKSDTYTKAEVDDLTKFSIGGGGEAGDDFSVKDLKINDVDDLEHTLITGQFGKDYVDTMTSTSDGTQISDIDYSKISDDVKFKSNDAVSSLFINTGLVKDKNLLTEDKIQDLIDAGGGGGTGGDAKFNTGEKTSDVLLEKKDETDLTLLGKELINDNLTTATTSSDGKLWSEIDSSTLGGDAKFRNDLPLSNYDLNNDDDLPNSLHTSDKIKEYVDTKTQTSDGTQISDVDISAIEENSIFATNEKPKDLSINSGDTDDTTLLTKDIIQNLIDAGGGGGTVSALFADGTKTDTQATKAETLIDTNNTDVIKPELDKKADVATTYTKDEVDAKTKFKDDSLVNAYTINDITDLPNSLITGDNINNSIDAATTSTDGKKWSEIDSSTLGGVSKFATDEEINTIGLDLKDATDLTLVGEAKAKDYVDNADSTLQTNIDLKANITDVYTKDEVDNKTKFSTNEEINSLAINTGDTDDITLLTKDEIQALIDAGGGGDEYVRIKVSDSTDTYATKVDNNGMHVQLDTLDNKTGELLSSFFVNKNYSYYERTVDGNAIRDWEFGKTGFILRDGYIPDKDSSVATKKYVDDNAGGSAIFSSGEDITTIAIDKLDDNDLTLIAEKKAISLLTAATVTGKLYVDNADSALQTNIDLKANIVDVYTKTEVDAEVTFTSGEKVKDVDLSTIGKEAVFNTSEKVSDILIEKKDETDLTLLGKELINDNITLAGTFSNGWVVKDTAYYGILSDYMTHDTKYATIIDFKNDKLDFVDSKLASDALVWLKDNAGGSAVFATGQDIGTINLDMKDATDLTLVGEAKAIDYIATKTKFKTGQIVSETDFPDISSGGIPWKHTGFGAPHGYIEVTDTGSEDANANLVSREINLEDKDVRFRWKLDSKGKIWKQPFNQEWEEVNLSGATFKNDTPTNQYDINNKDDLENSLFTGNNIVDYAVATESSSSTRKGEFNYGDDKGSPTIKSTVIDGDETGAYAALKVGSYGIDYVMFDETGTEKSYIPNSWRNLTNKKYVDEKTKFKTGEVVSEVDYPSGGSGGSPTDVLLDEPMGSSTSSFEVSDATTNYTIINVVMISTGTMYSHSFVVHNLDTRLKEAYFYNNDTIKLSMETTGTTAKFIAAGAKLMKIIGVK